jgi:hypothetical protein
MRAAGRTMAELSASLGRGITSLTRAMAETIDQIGNAIGAVVNAVALPSPSIALPNIHSSARNLAAEPSQVVRPSATGIENCPAPRLRLVEPDKPMPEAPVIPPFRPIAPLRRSCPVPQSWSQSLRVVPPISRPVSSRPAMPTLSPSSASMEPRKPPSRLSLAEAIRETFGPDVIIVWERSETLAA